MLTKEGYKRTFVQFLTEVVDLQKLDFMKPVSILIFSDFNDLDPLDSFVADSIMLDLDIENLILLRNGFKIGIIPIKILENTVYHIDLCEFYIGIRLITNNNFTNDNLVSIDDINEFMNTK